jgi:archaellum component FlaC
MHQDGEEVHMIDEKRFEALEARVGYLERENEGEKRVTRHILEQTRAISEDLAKLSTRMARVETKVDTLETKVDRLEIKFDGFVSGFSKIVADVVREVLAERKS